MIGDKRLAIVHAVLLLFAAALVTRAGIVQLWQRERWGTLAERQHLKSGALPAPRGDIRDASGTPLAQSRELVRLAIAPRDVRPRDRKKLAQLLRRVDVKAPFVARAADTTRAWVEVPGYFDRSDVAQAIAMRGVFPTAAAQRDYVESEGVRRIVGRMDGRGAAIDGIELALDSLLRGADGRASGVRDARGRTVESPESPRAEPRAGHSVTLTISRTLQEIADRALADAVRKMGASGGDIVVLNPHNGEILALAARRSDPRSTGSPAFTETFEPGSTLKPFVVGGLLARGRAKSSDIVETYNGVLTINGRTIHDVHAAPRLSLTDVVRFSSNVGMVQFAQRLSAGEQYETLRDFGFGTPTGVTYPSEAAGMLFEPRRWTKMSPASLAIGYEITVTPLQLALAYASIANGGELLAPALIREVRTPDSSLVYRHAKRVVRRVLPTNVAAQLRRMLVGVVDSGTATEADMATFSIGGKSGTARRTSGGSYKAGSYTATFVGLFPAERPQYVILVKLDNPKGTYYGGRTAAPVSKVVLEAAIAARDAALDRGALTSRKAQPMIAAESATGKEAKGSALDRSRASAGSLDSISIVRAQIEESPETPSGRVPFIVNLGDRAARAPVTVRVRPVPDVRGLPLRTAVRALHQSGFQVELARGANGATVPGAGTPARAGSVVRLFRSQ